MTRTLWTATINGTRYLQNSGYAYHQANGIREVARASIDLLVSLGRLADISGARHWPAHNTPWSCATLHGLVPDADLGRAYRKIRQSHVDGDTSGIRH